MSHGDKIDSLPTGFECIASTVNTPYAVIGKDNIFGLQFHPEVSHTNNGIQILKNFVYKVCGCVGDWTPENFISKSVNEIKNIVGTDTVICALSGGVDSSTCAALIYCMVQRAVNELGIERFKERLSYFAQIQEAETVEQIMPAMLSCVYQATANSGDVTENAAKSLADEISSTYNFFDVESLVQGYKSIVSKAVKREFTWEQDDLALQNIQARVRAPGIWFMTNLRGGLLVTTSNRSEAAVGYATMDGDTCGSICPLGGVDKTFLRNWLRKVEHTSLCGCLPIPSLKFVNEQEPTAELRPKGSEQKDEEDLMPYDVLDYIEKSSIRDKKSPADIYNGLLEVFQADPEKAYFWLEKFYALWSRNQWKRERYAPSFHMDDENLDPKTWCRFPILSGAYKRELARLKSQIFK